MLIAISGCDSEETMVLDGKPMQFGTYVKVLLWRKMSETHNNRSVCGLRTKGIFNLSK